MDSLEPIKRKIFLKSQFATSNSPDNQEDSMFKVTNCYLEQWTWFKYPPYAFTELGVAMLSSVLKSEIAIKVNREIMRAFVEFRRMATTLALPNTAADVAQLRKDFEDLKLDIEDILHDQNDINEATRAQLDAISAALAELQSKEPRQKPRRPIGFVTPSEEADTAADGASKITPPNNVNYLLSILYAPYRVTKRHAGMAFLRALILIPVLLFACLVSSCNKDEDGDSEDFMTQLYHESQTLQYQTADSVALFSVKFYDYLELNPDAYNHPYYGEITDKIYEFSPKCITVNDEWEGEKYLNF